MNNQRDRYAQESQYRPDPRYDRERYNEREHNDYERRGSNREGSNYGDRSSNTEWQNEYDRNSRRDMDASRRYAGDEGWGTQRSDRFSEHPLNSNNDWNDRQWYRNDREQSQQGGFRAEGGRGNGMNTYQGGNTSDYRESNAYLGDQASNSRYRNANGQFASQGMHTGKGPKGYRRSDERITEDVNEALSQHGELDASEIEVKVQNGEVTLSGTVEERSDKRMAEEIAERCSGVHDVRNDIRVQKSSSESASTQSSKGKQANGSSKMSESKAS